MSVTNHKDFEGQQGERNDIKHFSRMQKASINSLSDENTNTAEFKLGSDGTAERNF